MNLLESLTRREYEVLSLLSKGKQNKEIARSLNITEHTVEQHLKSIYRKLTVCNRVEASRLFWIYNAREEK